MNAQKSEVSELLDDLCSDETVKISRSMVFEENKLQAQLDNPVATINQLERMVDHFELNVIDLSTKLESERSSHQRTVHIHEVAEALYRMGMGDRDAEIVRLKHELVIVGGERDTAVKQIDGMFADLSEYEAENRDMPTKTTKPLILQGKEKTPTGWGLIQPDLQIAANKGKTSKAGMKPLSVG